MKPPPQPPAAITSARAHVKRLHGVWAFPTCISSNRFHFIEDRAATCLCGRWKRSELIMKSAEARTSISILDAKKCVAEYRRRTGM